MERLRNTYDKYRKKYHNKWISTQPHVSLTHFAFKTPYDIDIVMAVNKWVGYSPKFPVGTRSFGLSHEDAHDI